MRDAMAVVQQPTIFLRVGRPISANKTVPQKYRNDVRAADLGAGGTRKEGDRYGLVYWFVRRYDPTIHPDADNISKPVWDALEGVAYGDDKSVKLRSAGIVDLGATASYASFERLDFTDLPRSVLSDLSALVAARQDFLNIEIGMAHASMLTFNRMATARI